MVGGVFALLVATFSLLRHEPWTFSYRDASFWGIAALLIVTRYVDVSRFSGRTASGEPATSKDFATYAIGLLVVAASIWTLAQSVQW
jgi:hypothetical protein